MSETAQAGLNLRVQDEPRVVLEFAEWWDPASRFAVVRFSTDGVLNEHGLRLDLDKRAFLDSLDDERLNDAVRRQASSISQSIATERAGRR